MQSKIITPRLTPTKINAMKIIEDSKCTQLLMVSEDDLWCFLEQIVRLVSSIHYMNWFYFLKAYFLLIAVITKTITDSYSIARIHISLIITIILFIMFRNLCTSSKFYFCFVNWKKNAFILYSYKIIVFDSKRISHQNFKIESNSLELPLVSM